MRRSPGQLELGNQAGIALGTGLAGALVGVTGATAAGLTGVFAVAAAGAVLALLLSTRLAQAPDDKPVAPATPIPAGSGGKNRTMSRAA